MVCYHPLQAEFKTLPSGKKELKFGSALANAASLAFSAGSDVSDLTRVLAVPCGKCIGCRLEKSRQWAMRCMHEASLHADNCFLTLTYDDVHLPADGSLVKRDLQLFLKRLRYRYADKRIRYYGCGEYGEQLSRPHYHLCVFGFVFSDCYLFKRGAHALYVSDALTDLWGKGHCTVGDLTFDSAAYVARYCTKKVNGPLADDHYKGRQPEFSVMSLRPGIGADWYRKFKSDCFPSDWLVVNGHKCKPPRYYERLLERENPALLASLREARAEAVSGDGDSSYRRLLDREKCKHSHFRKLIRNIERS